MPKFRGRDDRRSRDEPSVDKFVDAAWLLRDFEVGTRLQSSQLLIPKDTTIGPCHMD